MVDDNDDAALADNELDPSLEDVEPEDEASVPPADEPEPMQAGSEDVP